MVDLCRRDLAFIWLTKGQKPQRDVFYNFKEKKLTGGSPGRSELPVHAPTGERRAYYPERTLY